MQSRVIALLAGFNLSYLSFLVLLWLSLNLQKSEIEYNPRHLRIFIKYLRRVVFVNSLSENHLR